MIKVKRQFEPSVRRTNGLVIYFKNKSVVQVQQGSAVVIFTRYFPTRGFYKLSWAPFCEKLYRRNNLETIWDVMDLARQYEIDMHSPYPGEYVKPVGVRERPSVYIERRKAKR